MTRKKEKELEFSFNGKIIKKKLVGIALISATTLFLLVGFLILSKFNGNTFPIPEETLKSVQDSISKETMESFVKIAEYLKLSKKFENISSMKPHGYLLVDSTTELKSSSIVKALAGEVNSPFIRILFNDFDDSKRIKNILKNVSRLGKAVVFVENLEALAKINVTGVDLIT